MALWYCNVTYKLRIGLHGGDLILTIQVKRNLSFGRYDLRIERLSNKEEGEYQRLAINLPDQIRQREYNLHINGKYYIQIASYLKHIFALICYNVHL